MATINVYDENTGLTKQITIDIAEARVAGSGTGRGQFYVTVSTSAKDPDGGTPPTLILTDFADDLTTEIKASIVELFRHIDGQHLPSSESSASSNTPSSVTIGSSTSSSTSSVVERLADVSTSSQSSESPSSVTSVSSQTNSVSSVSSVSSRGESSQSSASGV
jgi:hypothetical protein